MTDKIILKDGRNLGYAEYGDRTGYPILYFHGFPGSRLDPLMLNANSICKDIGIRLIAPDRPGMGLSDLKKGRTLLDWPDDVSELIHSLGIEKYSVIGYSGGGPYALACAFKLNDRVSKVGILSGMGPYRSLLDGNGGVNILIKPISPLRKFILLMMRSQIMKGPEEFFSRSKFSEPDDEIMKLPQIKRSLFHSMKEGMRSGIQGSFNDSQIYRGDWGFEMKDIRCEVLLWHGSDDDQVPISVGKFMSREIPNCRSKFVEGEGHISLAYLNFKEILEKLK